MSGIIMVNDHHVCGRSFYEDLWRYANSSVDQSSMCWRGQKASFEYRYMCQRFNRSMHGQIWNCVNVLSAAHQNGCHKTHTHTHTTSTTGCYAPESLVLMNTLASFCSVNWTSWIRHHSTCQPEPYTHPSLAGQPLLIPGREESTWQT